LSLLLWHNVEYQLCYIKRYGITFVCHKVIVTHVFIYALWGNSGKVKTIVGSTISITIQFHTNMLLQVMHAFPLACPTILVWSKHVIKNKLHNINLVIHQTQSENCYLKCSSHRNQDPRQRDYKIDGHNNVGHLMWH
jgi:hypothetical protein